MINKALAVASQSSSAASMDEYERFKKNIMSTRDFYSRNRWIDQRQVW
jgi:hypothetical protein